jgi:hypothetical protein
VPSAVALALSEFPEARHGDLSERIHDRGGEREARFYWRVPRPVLPVIDGGRLQLVAWGNKDRRGKLPLTGWTWRRSVESGAWVNLGCEVESVVIPAAHAFDRGVWYRVAEGVHGVLVRTPAGDRHVYMVCEPPTRYYRVMTRSGRMPWLIGQVI